MHHLELLKKSHYDVPSFFKRINGLIEKVSFPVHVMPNMRRQGIMVTTEQRANLSLLLTHVLDDRIPGDVVELGCYDGQSAVVLGSVIHDSSDYLNLHLFDNFKSVYGENVDAQARLLDRFKKNDLTAPILHVGDFGNTLSGQLPEQICFAHFDCGNGDDPKEHAIRIDHCLEEVYKRMPVGAIGVLMDYHDPYLTISGWDSNPGVKQACDKFFQNKEEVMRPLYGGEFSHGYFRKE